MDGTRLYYPRCRSILSLVFDGFGAPEDDSEEVIVPILVRSATVHKNSYKQADSYELTFDANDLPLDPDLIRAGAAQVFLYQSRDGETDDFVMSRQYALTEDTSGFLPRDVNASLAFEAELETAIRRWTLGNPAIIAGTFDEIDGDYASGGKWVTVRGQDYTAYLAGRQWPPTAQKTAQRIPVGRRLDVILREIISEADPRGKLRLALRGIKDGEVPIVKPDSNGHKRGIPVDSKTSYWDVMYKLAIRHGYILYVDGLDVCLAAPKNLASTHDGRIHEFRWGANIEKLQLKRRMGKEVVPTIVMQGVDKNGKTVEVEYPPNSRKIDKPRAAAAKADVKDHHHTTNVKAAKAPPKEAAHGGFQKKIGKRSTTVHSKDEFVIVPAGNISDPKTLLRMAETRFTLLGRGERGVVLSTKDLLDLDGDADFLRLTAGDAIRIVFDDFNSEVLANENIPRDAKLGHLLARGYAPRIAQLMVDRYQTLQGLRRPLRLREVTYQFDVESGVAIELEAVDFMVVEDARTAAASTALTGAFTGAVARRELRLVRADGSRVGFKTAAEEKNILHPRRTP